MRVVGGTLRGRALLAPSSQAVRPTSDRVRESLFNVIAHAHPHALTGRVVDLFAGTGALGIEALSRGCTSGLFVDSSTEGRGLLRENIDALGLGGRAKISRRDATALGPLTREEPFGLAFLDPPYGKGLGERAVASLVEGRWLAHGALLALEERKDAVPKALAGFERVDLRVFGATEIGLFVRRAAEEP